MRDEKRPRCSTRISINTPRKRGSCQRAIRFKELPFRLFVRESAHIHQLASGASIECYRIMPMKTHIVVARNISESEKLKSLACFGEASFDRRFMSPLSLAEYLLQLSGVTYQERFIQNEELSASLYTKIKGIAYFEKFTYGDILHLIETLQDVRYHIVADEAKAIHSQLGSVQAFKKKNEAILQVYDLLQEFLQTSGCIDEAGVVRFALEKTRSFPDLEIVYHEESHLRPLEIALLNKAAGKTPDAPLKETEIGDPNKPLVIKSYLKSFGQSNEIEDILSYIYEKGIPVDQCLIACSSAPNYANILSNYRDLSRLGSTPLPLTIGIGRPLALTNPGRLFSCIKDWRAAHYHGEYLQKIVDCLSFDLERFKEDISFPEDLAEVNAGLSRRHQITLDSVLQTAGDLRVRFDETWNRPHLEAYQDLLKRRKKDNPKDEETESLLRAIPFLQRIVEIFDKGERDFLKSYSLIKDEKADRNALAKIDRFLSFGETYSVSRADIEKQISDQTVSRESPQPGSLYFTTISRASSCLRKYLFIVGLSSALFPGKNMENPIFLDKDYEAFGVHNASLREIKENKEDFFALLEEANARGAEIHLSWPCYNEETLKTQNPSSVVFEAYQREYGKDKTIADFEGEFIDDDAEDKMRRTGKFRYAEFFEHNLLPINSIGRAIAHNKTLHNDEGEGTDPQASESADPDVPVQSMPSNHYFSATAVEDYAHCPYLFFLKQILRLTSEKEADPDDIIPRNDLGTLAHGLLETLVKTPDGEAAFLQEAERRFDEYLVFHPTETPALAIAEKEEFLQMMRNAYQMEESKPIAEAEEEIFQKHDPSGLCIRGRPDKVVKVAPGIVRIIDYKTGHRVKHDANQPADMVQCTMYAYLYEKKHPDIRVDGFEYRYIRILDSVFSSDVSVVDQTPMEHHYQQLNEVLKELKESLDTGSFLPNKNHCGDCYFKDICKKK